MSLVYLLLFYVFLNLGLFRIIKAHVCPERGGLARAIQKPVSDSYNPNALG